MYKSRELTEQLVKSGEVNNGAEREENITVITHCNEGKRFRVNFSTWRLKSLRNLFI